MTFSRFLAKIEERFQRWLSQFPILYGFIGGVGVVLFWRGVWHSMDFLSMYYLAHQAGEATTDFSGIWDALVSIVIGTGLLLPTGLFVSTFIGNEITISGLRGEVKLTERTETEVRTETGALHEIRAEVRKIRERVDKLAEK